MVKILPSLRSMWAAELNGGEGCGTALARAWLDLGEPEFAEERRTIERGECL